MSDDNKTLTELDAELDKVLLGIVRDGVTAVDKDGKIVTLSPPAAYLNVARLRLKDQGVSSPGEKPDLAAMAQELGLSLDQPLPPVDEPE